MPTDVARVQDRWVPCDGPNGWGIFIPGGELDLRTSEDLACEVA